MQEVQLRAAGAAAAETAEDAAAVIRTFSITKHTNEVYINMLYNINDNAQKKFCALIFL